MSETKHTPGPWSYNQDSEVVNVGEDNCPDGDDCDDFRIADTNGDLFERPPDERIANGHLIAAAPELLEACQGFLNLLDAKVCPKDIVGWATAQTKATIKMRNAISKATPVTEIESE